mmetsp:Transcript_73690/g.116698  ORF Transcript_73690/g.116698 Transcript_73690/m.116698 type:complete len:188 (-) Transcript_73690:72-635(-)|eukprot:CAMPEP_0169175564 /NCGR_PEP_ID=MMETSP1015-20121227/65347_1 /TAXON_ID=342587 /ORGANISM="Karlodinium micrum, Strain CCMP2283" /LENGTH=187 /DNA_ID=CAMNT_0009249899 /DNA_START=37 /DNA_END=600 /DNA_ORIENTATION=+
MILPMPALPFPMGGASEYARSMSSVMLAILIIQSVTCAFRMVLLLDIMGGFIMAIAIGLGWYAWKEDMHITFICYWGLMSLFNGVFDLVKLIDFQVKSPLPMFSSDAPMMYNVASMIQLAIPFSALAGCVLAWYLYKDATGSPVESSFTRRSPPGRSQENSSFFNRQSQQSQFKTFGGSGNRLGDAV